MCISLVHFPRGSAGGCAQWNGSLGRFPRPGTVLVIGQRSDQVIMKLKAIKQAWHRQRSLFKKAAKSFLPF